MRSNLHQYEQLNHCVEHPLKMLGQKKKTTLLQAAHAIKTVCDAGHPDEACQRAHGGCGHPHQSSLGVAQWDARNRHREEGPRAHQL